MNVKKKTPKNKKLLTMAFIAFFIVQVAICGVIFITSLNKGVF